MDMDMDADITEVGSPMGFLEIRRKECMMGRLMHPADQVVVNRLVPLIRLLARSVRRLDGEAPVVVVELRSGGPFVVGASDSTVIPSALTAVLVDGCMDRLMMDLGRIRGWMGARVVECKCECKSASTRVQECKCKQDRGRGGGEADEVP